MEQLMLKKKKVKKIGTVKVTVKNAIFDKKNFIKKLLLVINLRWKY